MILDPRVGYVQDLCNKYGDFKVATSWKNAQGEVLWSKHRSVMQLWQDEDGLRFLQRVTHRQILTQEIVLDFDTQESLTKIREAMEYLKEMKGITFKLFETGSKGYHIHIFFKTDDLNPKIRKRAKEMLCERFLCDLHKANDNVMIALENVPHWKSGKLKREVSYGEYINRRIDEQNSGR